LKDFFQVTVSVVTTGQAMVVVDDGRLPRFLVTPLRIDPSLQSIDIGGKSYYLDSWRVPFGFEKFVWKRDYLDARVLFLTGQGERLIDGRRYAELGGQRNYYDQSSGLLVLIVYDYMLVDKSSGNTSRTAGKLLATDLSADPFPWKAQFRWSALAAVSSLLALVTVVRFGVIRGKSATS